MLLGRLEWMTELVTAAEKKGPKALSGPAEDLCLIIRQHYQPVP
jgi:hypothetical protein